MSLSVYVNGEYQAKEKAAVSVFDHGFLYGDGVFEGIRAYGRVVFKLAEHIDRLFYSARAIRLEVPLDRAALAQAVCDTLKRNNLDDAYIRVVVSRGTGDLGLDPDKCPKPTVIIITDKITLYPEKFYREGLTIATVPTRRNIPEALNPRIKSLNYLNNILAKIEAKQLGVLEAIMMNAEGYVAECTGDNIFIAKNGVVSTPPCSAGILKGITRDTVIDILREQGGECRETNLTRFDLYEADECFLTGTAAEVIPVVEIDGRPIGTRRVGPLVTRITARFRELVRELGVRY